MAHTGIFATSAECIAKAGSDYDSTAVDESMINDFCAQVESYINVVTRENWSDSYSTLNVDVRRILSEATSNLVGVYMINYNMKNHLGLSYAQFKISILMQRFTDCIYQLLDKKRETFIDGE